MTEYHLNPGMIETYPVVGRHGWEWEHDHDDLIDGTCHAEGCGQGVGQETDEGRVFITFIGPDGNLYCEDCAYDPDLRYEYVPADRIGE
jgi:hypothetical protein